MENTPLYHALRAFADTNPLRMHMPGHKGRPLPAPELAGLSALDFTELPPTGDLFSGGDAIEAAEKLWAEVFHMAHCLFLTGGATQGVQAALALACKPGDAVLLDRGSHRSAYNALALLDLRPVYLERPWLPAAGVTGPVDPAAVEAALKNRPEIKTVCITSPTYAGILSDVAEISTKFASQLKGNPEVVVYDELPRLRTDPVIFFTLDINMQANPDVGSGKLDGNGIPSDFFADKDVRKGFEYAFDYEAFLQESMEGRGEMALGPAPAGLVKYDKGFKRYSFDLEKAKEHFKKAWGGQVWDKGFKFTITYNTSGDMRQIATEILKRNVESLNPKFKIDLRGVTWPAFLEKTAKRQMPMWARGWVADYADAHNFYFPFIHSQGRYALSQGYSNPQADALIEQAVSETNFAKRNALYKQVHNLMHDDAMQIYTVHPTGLWAMRSKVKNFVDNPVYMGIYFYPMYKE